MPRELMISIPAWGEWHATACVHAAMRSVRAALACNPFDKVRFLVHTDRSDFLRPAFRGLDVEFRAVPAHPVFYVAMGNCHRDALASARPGECIVLMCADQMISAESLSACRRLLKEGKRAVYCAGPRTLGHPADAPAGLLGRDLLAWGLKNLHPWNRELVYGTGRARALSLVYFRGGVSTVVHGFHLHPFAVLNDRSLSFRRATLDLDLVDCFAREEIHVVCDPDELATVEISPASRMVALAASPFTGADVAQWACSNASPMHEWLFAHRIVLSGDGTDCGDTKVLAEIRAAALAKAA